MNKDAHNRGFCEKLRVFSVSFCILQFIRDVWVLCAFSGFIFQTVSVDILAPTLSWVTSYALGLTTEIHTTARPLFSILNSHGAKQEVPVTSALIVQAGCYNTQREGCAWDGRICSLRKILLFDT